jgi:hypothetical protein
MIQQRFQARRVRDLKTTLENNFLGCFRRWEGSIRDPDHSDEDREWYGFQAFVAGTAWYRSGERAPTFVTELAYLQYDFGHRYAPGTDARLHAKEKLEYASQCGVKKAQDMLKKLEKTNGQFLL